MKRIWAPWRLKYILGDKPDGCIFCEKADATSDQGDLVLYRGKYCYIMMNRYPYNNGHLMVVSKKHIDLPTKLSVEAQTELMQQINMCLEVLQEAMRPNGFNVGMNLGTCAGAGIKDHLHVHIVPRWTGDTNFMPVLGDTHVIVEGLESCYDKLKPLFDRKRDKTDQ
jgi:ATP adenylyltransferase